MWMGTALRVWKTPPSKAIDSIEVREDTERTAD